MNIDDAKNSRIVRLPEVMERTSLSRSTIYRYIALGKFPKSKPLGVRAVGWRDSEISEWVDRL